MRPHAAAYSDRPELYGITCAEAHVTYTIQGQFIPTKGPFIIKLAPGE